MSVRVDLGTLLVRSPKPRKICQQHLLVVETLCLRHVCVPGADPDGEGKFISIAARQIMTRIVKQTGLLLILFAALIVAGCDEPPLTSSELAATEADAEAAPYTCRLTELDAKMTTFTIPCRSFTKQQKTT